MFLETLLALGLGGFGYFKTRKFVRERLRFVDAIQRPVAPVVVGVAAGFAVAVIPFVGGLAIPILAGLGIGAGVSHGVKDSKKLPAP